MYEVTNGSHRDRLFRVRRGGPVVLRPRETRVLDLILPPEPLLAQWRRDGVVIERPARPVAPDIRPAPPPAPAAVEVVAAPAPVAPVSVVHAVEIPADWRSLSWPQRRSLASKLTDEPISNGDVAERVIAAEIERRNA